MMLIIADKSPDKAVDWLVENTNKNFCFKQLLELGQLVCSAGISNVYKPVKQGKELQKWIVENPFFVKQFFYYLIAFCFVNVKLEEKTRKDLLFIYQKLSSYCFKNRKNDEKITTAIWRYSKEYSSEYATNSELPIEVVTELYKKYITEFKFKKSEVQNV